MVKLSIIVPVYNVEQYIGQCLDSIFNNNIDESLYEVIVVDDGTPDNSMKVVEPYVKKHSNLKIVHQKNQGLSVARNTGFANSSGEYVWFVDSDDWLVDMVLDKIYNILLSADNYDIISSPLLRVYDDESRNRMDIKLENDTIVSGLEYLKKGYGIGAVVRYVIKRNLITKANILFYPGILHEDALFGPQIVYQAEKIMILKEPIYYYRQRSEGSIMSSRTIRSAYDLMTVHKQLIKYMDAYVKPEDKDWFRLNSYDTFITALMFTSHLKDTPEYRQFLHDSCAYRRQESFKCFKIASSKEKLIFLLYLITPIYADSILESVHKVKRMLLGKNK